MADLRNTNAGILNTFEYNNRKPISLRYDNSFSTIRGIVAENAAPSILPHVHNYIGEVLFVFPEGATANDSLWSSFQSLSISEKPKVQIIARIPEIHVTIPIPKSSDDFGVISLYPTYTAIDSTLDRPEVGDLVLLDYKDKQSFANPIYLGKLDDQKRGTSKNSISASAKSSFEKSSASQTVFNPNLTVKKIGAWAMRGAVYNPDQALKKALDIGLTDISFSTHAQTEKEFSPFVSPKKMAQNCKLFFDNGIKPHIMVWPRPSFEHSNKVLDYVNEVYRLAPFIESSDLDAEEQWTRHPLLEENGRQIASLYRSRWPNGLLLAVNGITAVLPKLTDLISVADIVWPQAYSTTKFGQTTQPGDRQTFVASKWREKMRPGSKLGMGLAAYSQEGAGGLTASDALSRSFQSAVRETDEIRYWSLESLTGASKDFAKAATKQIK